MRAMWEAVVLLTALVLLPSCPAEVLGEEPEDGTLSGVVRDARTHEPIAWANVMVVGSKSGAITLPDGTYRIRGIPAGKHRVVFDMIGYERRTFEDVQILPGEETSLFADLGEKGWEAKELRKGRQAARRVSRAEEASVAEVADSANAFAWELFHVLSRHEGNLVFSPLSISMALAMTSAGAGGGTREQMRSVLHLLSDEERLHAAWAEILNSLLRGAEAGSYRLDVSNRLLGHGSHNFVEPFLTVARERYAAHLEAVDFVGRPEESREVINEAVTDEAGGRITSLIPPGGITPLTRLALVNTVYFLGLWEEPFQKAITTDEHFFLSETDSVLVPMMHTTSEFRYAEIGEADLQLLEMPYESDQISMIVALPGHRKGVDGLERDMDGARLREWIKELRGRQVRVHFPRFRIESEVSLKQKLSELGMASAFVEGEADFSRMDGARDLVISDVFHKSFVEVTEEGTEAAAATAAMMDLIGVSPDEPPPPPLFTANHPFLFVIRDRVTGSILFIGRVVDPSTT